MTTLLLTLDHEGRDWDFQIQVDGPASVGDVVDAVIEHGTFDRTPFVPSLEVVRLSETLARETRLTDARLRSGDRVVFRDASGAFGYERLSAAATVEVVEGSDMGRTFELRPGPSDIGRAPDCDIQIADELVSRHHARVVVGDEIHIADLGSTNGVLVNEEPITGSETVVASDRVTVGGTVFQFRLVDTHSENTTGPVVEFNRPPQVFRPFGGSEVKLPAPPEDPPKQYLPMIAALIPLLMGGVMYFVFGPLGALFMLMSPVMVLGSYFEGRRSGRNTHKARVEEHEEMLRRSIATLDEDREEEIASRHREFPAVVEVVQFVRRLSSRLWERHSDEKEFLTLRVGRAEQKSRTSIELESGGSRTMRDEMAEIPPRYASIPSLPAVADLRDVGGLGIAGPIKQSNRLARSLIVQLAGLHTPNEVIISALLGNQEAPEWKWLSWLPHVRSSISPIGGSHIGTDAQTCSQVLKELLTELERRFEKLDRNMSDAPPPLPAIVVLVDEGVPLDRTRLSPLLENGPIASINFIWIGSTRGRLPRSCAAVVDLEARTGDVTLGFRVSGDEIGAVDVEGLSLEEAGEFARALSPVVEIGGRDGTVASVPRMVGLVEVLGGTEIMNDPGAVTDRWQQGEELLTEGRKLQLRAPIGRQADAPLSVDIRSDGPHVLVAGTTGAGKSELLQTYVASLAATHSARRVTFLLVDYKGGAAFKDCVQLPHVVGLVTDLNTSEVRRALVSLEAELRYRELILNEAGAKDLVELEGMRHPTTPPTLILIVDEFAALAKEVPEFIEGVVDVALRGRSLGLHLVLATQRPAGVITPQIRANTNLRIALRVADDEDSSDVIGSKDAAGLDPGIPGRAIAKFGPRDSVLFQSAYAGGFTQAAATGPTIHVSQLEFDRAVPIAKRNKRNSLKAAEDASDLQRLVGNVERAHTMSGMDDPRRPWLQPLAEVYDLARLRRPDNDQRIVVGVSDIPSRQRQVMAHFEPDIQGSLLVLGASRSGKTVLLRTIVAAAALPRSGATTHVYGLDFAGRGLEMLGDLPHVGTIVLGQDDQRVVRLLRNLRTQIDDRSERFSAVRAGSLPEYRSTVGGRSDEPRIMVVVDGYAAFYSAYERVEGGRWVDWLTQLVGDGRQFGVHFVLTADRRTAFPLALSSAIPGRIVLRLATQDEYSSAGVPLDIITDSSPPGRAIYDGLETQIALLGGGVSGDAQMKAITALGGFLKRRVQTPASPVRILPEKVSLSMIARSSSGFTFGLRDTDLGPAVLPFDPGGFVVTGPPRSGKTTALEALVVGAPPTISGVVIVGTYATRLTRDRARCRVALGNDQGASLLRKVVESSVPNLLVVVDDLHEFVHTEVEDALVTLLRVARDRDLRIAVSSDTDAVRRAYDGALKDVRASKSGLLLQPDNSVDGDIVGVRLPSVVTTTWPPGRGYLAIRGIFELCHVGVAD